MQLTAYWSVELPRRLLLKFVLSGMLALAVASELAQGALPNGRDFDPLDIAANVIGSVLALALCGWYHKRMLERRRRRKLQGYGLVDGAAPEDVELGESGGSEPELGATATAAEEDDEGGEAWDDMDGGGGGGAGGAGGGAAASAEEPEATDGVGTK